MSKAKPKAPRARTSKKSQQENKLRIDFDSCGFLSLALMERPSGDPESLNPRFEFTREAEVDEEKSIISVTFEVLLYEGNGEGEDRATYMTAKYRSSFRVTGMEHVKVNDQGAKQFPIDFARSLIALTYSSMRGALAEKTARTWLEEQILPIFRANVLFAAEDETVNQGGNYPA